MKSKKKEFTKSPLFKSFSQNVQSPWFDTHQAAAYLNWSPATLKVWRSKETGPKYHSVNQRMIRYHVDDLDSFLRGEVRS